MQQWFLYALIAAVFIGVKDMMTKNLTKKFSYIEYIIIANIFIFIITMIYIFTMKPKLKRPNVKDGLFIFLRILIVLLIIEPCIFMALKHCDNPGYAKSIINLNTLVAFVLGLFILRNDFEIKNVIGIGLIVGGTLLIY
mgnify:FL=1|tara:strand:+ start:1264 stop:1680 length:417 start_codon:yes stop_codon:yes gene_type:complete